MGPQRSAVILILPRKRCDFSYFSSADVITGDRNTIGSSKPDGNKGMFGRNLPTRFA
jgi:hypothetical protein